jgi:hypothetical protein
MSRESTLAKRLVMLHRDPRAFLKYVARTNDSSDPTAPASSPFPYHLPYVRRLVEDIMVHPQICIEKSRQLIVSWTFAAYFSWELLTRPNVFGLAFAQNQLKTIEFGKRIKFILDNIDENIWPKSARPAHRATQEGIFVESMNSTLLTMTSSPDTGHGYTPTFTFFDEFAYHPYGEEGFRTIMGGAVKDTSRIYIVSTPAPIHGNESNKFYQVCDDTLDEVE